MHKKSYRWAVVVFLVCLLPRIYLALQMDFTMYVGDETSTLSAVTVFSDMNWSEAISRTGYYGGGFTVLFTPLYYIFRDPVFIYHIELVVMCILQAAIGLIAYHLQKRYYKVSDEYICVFLAIASSYTVTRRANNVTNEHPLYLIVWLTVWILLALTEAEKRKARILSLLLALITGYAVSIHERGIIFAGMLAVTILLCLWAYKSMLVRLEVFVPVYAIAFILSRALKRKILSVNWANAGNEVKNTGITFGNYKQWFKMMETKCGIASFCGPILTISLLTGGVFLLACLIGTYYLFQGIKRTEKITACQEKYSDQEKKNYLIYGYLFSGIAATLLSQSASWGKGLMAAMEAGAEQQGYGLKALTYIRYFGIFVAPLIMITMIWLMNHLKKCEKFFAWCFALFVGLEIVWIAYILPYIYKSTDASEAFLPFSGESSKNIKMGTGFYVIGLFVLGIMLLVEYILVKKKQYSFLAMLLAGFVIYQYIYNSYAFDKTGNKQKYIQIATYKELNRLDIMADIAEIYVYDNSSTSRIWLNYQLLFFERTIHVGLPEENVEASLIITKGLRNEDKLLKKGWKIINLDYDELGINNLWVKGSGVEEKLVLQGIELLSQRK